MFSGTNRRGRRADRASLGAAGGAVNVLAAGHLTGALGFAGRTGGDEPGSAGHPALSPRGPAPQIAL